MKQTTILWVLIAMLLMPALAEARLTRITAGPATVIDFPSFGATGPYLKIAGTFEGEIDPSDSRNAVIVDIGLAPQVSGKVATRRPSSSCARPTSRKATASSSTTLATVAANGFLNGSTMAQHLTIPRQPSTSATGS
jgi:hypothetical protein